MKPTKVASNSAFIENGLAEIFGEDLITIQQGAGESSKLIESAIKEFGTAEACGMFLRAGRAAFYYWMRVNAEYLGWREVDFRLLPAQARIKRALTDAIKWFETNQFLNGELSATDSAWQIAVTGLTGEGARLDCSTFIGLMQELTCWAGAGKFYSAREIECQVDGSSHCLFEIDKLPVG
ncbi:MAG: hypothetical protein CVU42_15965 [Chloroflexi bacterium HGW-Chloroflexi-4]|jgi:hypothetical protein|nr:MAG: hypothetical protein CVU42_15965 [Chloroflexi bacterium HGW-Chloroflexi-4]